MEEVRRRTETILVLAATDYQFAYHNPSLMAASAIMIALQSFSSALPMTGIKTRLQAATHTSMEQVDKCAHAIDAVLPEYLKRLSSNLTKLASSCQPADSTTPDLTCHEQLSLDGSSNTVNSSEDSNNTFFDSEYSLATPSSRSSSPLSAVDIFTEFNTNVLQPMFDQVEAGTQVDSFTILVS